MPVVVGNRLVPSVLDGVLNNSLALSVGVLSCNQLFPFHGDPCILVVDGNVVFLARIGSFTNKHVSLLPNMFLVSAGKVSLESSLQAYTIYTIRKRRSF
jgi:hypothetical protein